MKLFFTNCFQRLYWLDDSERAPTVLSRTRFGKTRDAVPVTMGQSGANVVVLVKFCKKKMGKPAFTVCYSNFLGSIAEVSEGFLFLLGKRFHVEILHGLDPVFVNLHGQGSHQAQTGGRIRKDADH